STATTYNPPASAWVIIGKIYGGHDYDTKKFRLQLASAYIHNHTRIRFRVSGKNDGPLYPYPIEDQDNFVVDAIQIAAPEAGKKLETDVEVTGLDLGSGNYNRVPRNVTTLYPKV